MKLILITIIFLCSNLNADPLTPLPTDFFDDKKIKSKKKMGPVKKNSKQKTISKTNRNFGKTI